MKATTKNTTKRTVKTNTKSTNKSTYNRVEAGISYWTNKKGKTMYYARTTGGYIGAFTSLSKARAARKAVMSK